MTLLSILALGFFLGMRHATDSDHVIAVTTIVSQQRKIGSSALTGIFWGIGHSITLLIVGGAIILFGGELNSSLFEYLEERKTAAATSPKSTRPRLTEAFGDRNA